MKSSIAKPGVYYLCCRTCNTERHRRYRKSKKGMAVVRAAVKRSEKRYPEKVKARGILNRHVVKGLVVKPNKCSHCGLEKPLEGHHSDYNLPLVVEWLCRQCHFMV